jgi:hypothetical protein
MGGIHLNKMALLEGNPYWDWLNDCTDEILIESTIKAKGKSAHFNSSLLNIK